MLIVVISTFYRLLGYTDMRDGLNHGLGTLLGFIYVPSSSVFIRLFLIDDISQPARIAFIPFSPQKFQIPRLFYRQSIWTKQTRQIIPPKKLGRSRRRHPLLFFHKYLWIFISNGHIGSLPFSFMHALVLAILFLSLAPPMIWLNRSLNAP